MEITLFLLASGLAYLIYQAYTTNWQLYPGDDDFDTDNENPDLPWEEGEYYL